MATIDNEGIVYLAVGDKFIKEATQSASSIKSVMPGISITLLTNKTVKSNCFDHTIQIPNPRGDGGDRVFHANKSPYSKTIFFDTDIYVTEPIGEVFDLLDDFDVAACINQSKYSSKRISIQEINNLPESFPEYNGGVLAFRKSERTNDFFALWKEMFRKVEQHGQVHNQAALRYALYHSDARLATMRNEYNCVFRRPGSVNGKVKIFHGRLRDLDTYGAPQNVNLEQAVQEINSCSNLRVYTRVADRIKLVRTSPLQRGWYSIRDRGLLETLKRVPPFLKRMLDSG